MSHGNHKNQNSSATQPTLPNAQPHPSWPLETPQEYIDNRALKATIKRDTDRVRDTLQTTTPHPKTSAVENMRRHAGRGYGAEDGRYSRHDQNQEAERRQQEADLRKQKAEIREQAIRDIKEGIERTLSRRS